MKNVFTDPGFKTFGQADSLWQLKVHEKLKAEPEVIGGVLSIPIKWALGNNRDVGLVYGPIPVKAGQRIAVGFDACASQPFKFNVTLGENREPYISLVSTENRFGEQLMPKSWHFFKHAFKVTKDEPEACLYFALGRSNTTLRIRNPRMRFLDA